MGHVFAPFGVQGQIKVHAYTEAIDGLLDYPTWWLGKAGSWREYKVGRATLNGSALVAQLEGVAGRDAALGLKGSQIAVTRDALPPAGPDEYYWSDLVGLKVVNAEGVDFGRVSGLLETGADDVLVVEGERQRLIPFAGRFILDVDLAAGQIRVDWGADY